MLSLQDYICTAHLQLQNPLEGVINADVPGWRPASRQICIDYSCGNPPNCVAVAAAEPSKILVEFTSVCLQSFLLLFFLLHHIASPFSQIGLLKTVAIAWIHGWDDMAKRVGAASANIYTMGYALAVVSTVVLASGLWDTMEDSSYLAVAIPYGLVSFGVTTIVAFTARRQKGMTLRQWWSSVVFTGTEAFRNQVSQSKFYSL